MVRFASNRIDTGAFARRPKSTVKGGMISQQTRVAGTRDYTGADQATLRFVRETIERTFRMYAYAAVDPPILARAQPFLDRSGEEIRRRLYVFTDPGGREVCLRPELTIPTCGLYLRDHPGAGPAKRLSYVGSAFRYETPGEGRYREFWQAGTEFIGGSDREGADAEVLAVAVHSLQAAGLEDVSLAVGDLGIIDAFIEGLPVATRWKARLRRIVHSGRDLRVLLERGLAGALHEAGAGGVQPGDLALLLATMDLERARAVVHEILTLADVRHVGGRSADEIADRLVTAAVESGVEPLSGEILASISTLLAIRATPPDEALQTVQDHAEALKIPGMMPVLERCARRLALFDAYQPRDCEIVFDVGLRRSLAFYTGFVFEVRSVHNPELGRLCGGGRYDNLLAALGGRVPTPAVGFAIGLDRVVLALQGPRTGAELDPFRPDAVVVPAGSVAHAACVRVSSALRRGGWSVEVEASGRRPRSVLTHSLKRGVPYLVFVGEEELAEGSVRVKRLGDRVERRVLLTDLSAFAAAEPAAGRTGKAE